MCLCPFCLFMVKYELFMIAISVSCEYIVLKGKSFLTTVHPNPKSYTINFSELLFEKAKTNTNLECLIKAQLTCLRFCASENIYFWFQSSTII